MALKSLRSKLLLFVSAFVVGSGFLISAIITERYSASLFETMMAQGENIAHAVALEAADEVLINDLVSLQKMLDHHIRSHSGVAYLFFMELQSLVFRTAVQLERTLRSTLKRHVNCDSGKSYRFFSLIQVESRGETSGRP